MAARASTAAALSPLKSISVLGMRVDATSYSDAVARIVHWAGRFESRAVAAGCVHMVIETHDDPSFRAVVNSYDIVTPDGMPLVWLLRGSGVANASRVYGPDLTRNLLAAASREAIPIGFYGGSPRTLDALLAVVQRDYPGAPIAYACAPPFRKLDEAEDRQVVEDIRRSGARILFVGLGCPKQERWIHEHRGRIPVPMIAVGAAFDFLAGVKPQAPAMVQRMGMEWLFRLLSEPRRLFWRYFSTNPRFIALVAIQLLTQRRQAA